VTPEDHGSPKASGDAKAFAIAWTLPFTLVVPMFVGGGIGYLLDRWLHTKPLCMLVLGILGLGIGVRDLVKATAMLDKKDGS
jgi:ATP synthase protein I